MTKLKPGPRSINPRLVARDVIAKIEKGEKIKMAPILRARGYSATVVDNPRNVTDSDGYKEEIESYTARLEKHRSNVLAAMEKKNLSAEQYRTLMDAEAKLTHDVQLLTGGKTENVGVEKDRETLKAIVAAIQVGQ